MPDNKLLRNFTIYIMTIPQDTIMPRPQGMTESEYAHCIARITTLQTLILKHKVLQIVCCWDSSHRKLLEVFRAQKAEYRVALGGPVA